MTYKLAVIGQGCTHECCLPNQDAAQIDATVPVWPIKNVEIVNIVLTPIYPMSEWGICLFSRVVCAP